ncbi:MAG: TIR domain-containing protein [Clostridiales bacterium]|nr:TIR domain-containing protein [Clostridiales bacterium]
MALRYITRGMSDPKGKPRVYFSCHPNDFSMAFPLVSEDILRQSNCAIWYDEDLSDGVDHVDEISDMQLVVFAVTSDFIFTPNRAREVELPYALERHIPVLPIMMETGLGYKFSNNCAKIQVVNRYVKDPTATPYEEVLKTFLTSVLIGDELAEKVRDAFDAYVFLSYRKKDRRHAQRLMRLIHENPQFRDIAIWYDEFLVPGEGFNEAIADAFRKSALFAMVVTPHLLEEGNYVMRVEYPMARDRKNGSGDNEFEIVPVEMYEDIDAVEGKDWRIDREALEGHEEFKYKRIEDLQDEHQKDAMDSAFVAALERIAKKCNDGSAQHRFFIGLAYLNGIDVEVDYARALGLLESAAADPKPCFEATEKLVEMYQTGDGVNLSIAMAIKWQKVLTEQYKEEYGKNYSPDEHKGFGTKYLKSLLKLSDLCREDKDIDAAIVAAEEAFALCEELKEEVGIRESERDMAVVCNRLGSLYLVRKEPDPAQRYYLKARQIYERLAREIGTARARKDLSIADERLGDLFRKKKELDQAKKYYEEAFSLRQELASDRSSATARRDLSSILTKLGNISKAGKDYPQAMEQYKEALSIDRSLSDELRTPQAADDCAVSLLKYGDILVKTGYPEEAMERFHEAEEILLKLISERPLLQYRRNYAATCEKIASAKKHSGDLESAEEYYVKSVGLREEIFATSPSDDVGHELAVACFNYGLFKKEEAPLLRAKEMWTALAMHDRSYVKYLSAVDEALGKLK